MICVHFPLIYNTEDRVYENGARVIGISYTKKSYPEVAYVSKTNNWRKEGTYDK